MHSLFKPKDLDLSRFTPIETEGTKSVENKALGYESEPGNQNETYVWIKVVVLTKQNRVQVVPYRLQQRMYEFHILF